MSSRVASRVPSELFRCGTVDCMNMRSSGILMRMRRSHGMPARRPDEKIRVYRSGSSPVSPDCAGTPLRAGVKQAALRLLERSEVSGPHVYLA